MEKHEGSDTQHSSPATLVVLWCQGIICETSLQIAQLLCAWVQKTTTELHTGFNFITFFPKKKDTFSFDYLDFILNGILPFLITLRSNAKTVQSEKGKGLKRREEGLRKQFKCWIPEVFSISSVRTKMSILWDINAWKTVFFRKSISLFIVECKCWEFKFTLHLNRNSDFIVTEICSGEVPKSVHFSCPLRTLSWQDLW